MKEAIERYWHAFFEMGIFIKGFNGIWETISGLAVLFVSKAALTGGFILLTQNELLEDPNDYLTNFLTHLAQNVSVNTKTFAAVYLIFHGVLNLFLTVQLYRKRHWAYIFTIWVVSLFVVYQIYRIFLHYSGILIVLTIIDILFIILTWHEYLHQKNKPQLQVK